MANRALITGITGQDGSYLAELLLAKGYEVIGMVRRSSTVNFERIAHIQDRVEFVAGDLLDEISMLSILREHRPNEVYNLAAQSFVQTSWTQPVFTGETTALGVTRILDAIRIVDPDIRFYQASSSEMFGKVLEVPQVESTPFYPRSGVLHPQDQPRRRPHPSRTGRRAPHGQPRGTTRLGIRRRLRRGHVVDAATTGK
jgi:GDPmannose 4,6-dehydratase